MGDIGIRVSWPQDEAKQAGHGPADAEANTEAETNTEAEINKQRRKLQNRKNQRARRLRLKDKDTETVQGSRPFKPSVPWSCEYHHPPPTSTQP
ncbi:hypothetical protein G7Z17_g10207 [Cylindrodendrum hubeiense]|uniref:Uncharacterized protein n=1 Tax=Cylindrodendrum hubeiense TaxID=595255 RepID=A0A9P5L7F7_9HYPO|nr:hypothetical protein G7Z17_g10207 [Cylindrodendrum hubeiense]